MIRNHPWVKSLLRDPVLTIANTVAALTIAWVLSALIGGLLVWWQDDVDGYFHGVYCAVGHMTTHGCDVEPSKGLGRLFSASLQVWGVLITASVVAHAIGSLIRDEKKFDDDDKQELLNELAAIRALLNKN